MDTIHHRLLYPSPVHQANLFDITNCQNERLFSRGIGIFFKPIGKCVKEGAHLAAVFQVSLHFLVPASVFSAVALGCCNITDKLIYCLLIYLTQRCKVLFNFKS